MNKNLRTKSFSKKGLLFFVIGFAAVGGLLIWRSFANTRTAYGDFNNDGVVNQADLTAIKASFGSYNAQYDANNDGLVNYLDVSVMLSHWGGTSPQLQPDLGMHTTNIPYSGIGEINDMQTTLHRPIKVVMWYQAWDPAPGGTTNTNMNLDPAWINSVIASGRIPEVTWEPWDYKGNASQPKYKLTNISGGMYDSYIQTWANGLKNINSTIYLRPMHEMNGNWYPWGANVNGNAPGDYVNAWRHMHDIFVNAGATNVKWIWSPNNYFSGDTPFEQFYPGANYVDVLALDGYNWGTTSYGWATFDQLFSANYSHITALGTQPVWIAETASSPNAPAGTSKAQWITDMWNTLPTNFPRITTIVWFSENKEQDWRADDNPATSAAFYLN